ncbi:RNA dependent RNA polymerase-domain-containing protein [Suillus tomentosus]|nr:RNA dependent RNA polymerase-domain-containing protein [Suillus tomentosus]
MAPKSRRDSFPASHRRPSGLSDQSPSLSIPRVLVGVNHKQFQPLRSAYYATTYNGYPSEGLTLQKTVPSLTCTVRTDSFANEQLYISANQGRNPRSGEPLTLHESVLELLQAAHLAADPYGVLEEGQIHFCSSELITDPESGARMNTVTEPVLVITSVWRNPTRLPSDVQKVNAVSHPKLDKYFDVIVFPVKGERSLASYLGGGDYDGDTVTLVWSKQLVENFNTAPLCMAPAGLSNNFEREVEHVEKFNERISNLSPKEAQTAFQKALLLGLADTKIGLYSKFHDLAVYERGYASVAAIRLAYMFTTCLDASKTGLQVKRRVFEEDRKNNGKQHRGPRGFEMQGLDALVDEGRRLRDDFLKQYSVLRSSSPSAADHDLTLPYLCASRRAAEALQAGSHVLQDNLSVVQAHVEEAHGKWQAAVSLQKKASEGRGSSDPKTQAIQNGSFGVSVAFAELCAIKTRAQGAVLFADRFAEVMCISNNTLRALSQAQDDADE